MTSTTPQDNLSTIAREYQVLHEVAQALQSSEDTESILQQVMKILIQFEELKVESKAGIFLADEEKKVLRLFTTVGCFTDEFLEREQEVPYGDCLCGRTAVSGELLTSDSCFTDARHERTFTDMTAHGHYIIPLKSREKLASDLMEDSERPPHESLSPREFQVMSLIASGKTVSEIAEELGVSVPTVSTFRARILEKMSMKTNAQLTHYAIKNGLLH
jgi:DNA-binding CsgD family transcriptional regulator